MTEGVWKDGKIVYYPPSDNYAPTPTPLDEHALIARLIEWEMKEHVAAKKHHGFTKGLEHAAEEKAYGRVIRLIQEGRGVRK